MSSDNNFSNDFYKNKRKKIHSDDIITELIHRWKVIIIFVVVMGGVAIFTVGSNVPLYKATSSMIIETGDSEVNMVDTYAPILLSDKILEKVVVALETNITASEIRARMDISSPKASNVITVDYYSTNPIVAKDIANAVINAAPGVIEEVGNPANVKVLDYAKIPDKTETPPYLKNILMGMIFGLILGAFFVIGYWIFVPKIRSEREIKENLNLDVLGILPKSKNSEGGIKSQLINNPEVGFDYTEAVKLLGLQLEKISLENNYQSFLMVSASEDDGKTDVSMNLAFTLANNGASVLFIESDVQKSDIFREFGEEFNAKYSYADFKESGVFERDSFAKYPGLDLYILPFKPDDSGNDNPLNENEIRQMILTMRNKFDYVIIDAPPAAILSDIAVISKSTDGIIFVVKENHTRLDVLVKMKNTLESTGTNFIGGILN